MILMISSRSRTHQQGFTLVELLVVVAILGVLLLLGSFSYVRSVSNARNVNFVEALAQDINSARSLAMAKGVNTQVQFTSLNSYTVTRFDASNQPISPPSVTNTNTAVTMSGIGVGDKLVCSSTGFCLAYTSAGVSTR